MAVIFKSIVFMRDSIPKYGLNKSVRLRFGRIDIQSEMKFPS